MAEQRASCIKRMSLAGTAAELVHHDEALGVEVFRRPGKPTGVCEIGFSGMRCKPDYAYRFGSPAAAEAYRETWLASKRSSADEKRARVEQRRDAAQQLAVGDVLVASWGYEQTNYDYYEVTRKVGARSVEIRKLQQEKTYDGQAMAGLCVPIKGRYVGEPVTKRVDAHGGVTVNHAHAVKKPFEIVGGVEVFRPDRFTAYA